MIYTSHTLSRSFSHALLTDITGTLHPLPYAKRRSTLSLMPVRAPPTVWRAPLIHPRWVSLHCLSSFQSDNLTSPPMHPLFQSNDLTSPTIHPLFEFDNLTSPHLTFDPPSISIQRPHLTSDPPSIWVRRPHLTSNPHTSNPPSTKANPHPLKPI